VIHASKGIQRGTSLPAEPQPWEATVIPELRLTRPKLTSVTWSITACTWFGLTLYDTAFSVTGTDLAPERYGFPPGTIQGLNLIDERENVIASAAHVHANFCGDPGTELPNGGDTAFGVYTSWNEEDRVYTNLHALLIFAPPTGGEISGETSIDGLTVEWKPPSP
jgi:hypothetical protein